MASSYARDWAHFIVDKLGLPYRKAEITQFADGGAGDDEIWNRFIASNRKYLEAAKANRIEGPGDVWRFFREASYCEMRGTFPSRSRGRTILGPRIVPLQKLEEQKQEEERKRNSYRVSLFALKELKDTVGKTIYHAADNGVVFGKGTIVDVNGEKHTIIVDFESGERRSLRYKECLSKGFIRFI